MPLLVSVISSLECTLCRIARTAVSHPGLFSNEVESAGFQKRALKRRYSTAVEAFMSLIGILAACVHGEPPAW